MDIEPLDLDFDVQPAPPPPSSPHHTRSGEMFNTTASKVDVVGRDGASAADHRDDLAHFRSIRALKTASEIPLTQAFVGDNQEAFRAALAKEQESLKRVLREVLPTDHDYSVAVKTARGARYIATIKRNGTCKIRGVEQGCFEDPILDGTNFNYCAHVSKFVTIRMALFRKDRHIRTIATIDISTAFLQSHRYKPHEPW